VSEFTLTPVSSLGSLRTPHVEREPDAASVIITERIGVSLCQVFARKGAHAQLAERAAGIFGVALPSTARWTGPAPISFVWAGPSQWLALGEERDGQTFADSLSSSFFGLASVIDLSDGRVIVRISGPRARDALAKGLHIDLHPSAFRPGDAAITAVSHIGVHFWQLDTVPTYEFTVFRSFAVAFCEWLAEASAEFGVTIIKSAADRCSTA
jgi:methylglutamate dehydrogenase subunit D